MNSVASIYVPRMSANWTEERIRNTMDMKSFGTVTRVDFVPVNKKPGFVENVDEDVKSAFIHFSDPVLTEQGTYRLSDDNYYTRSLAFWSAISNGEAYRLTVSDHEYWICLKNKNPIQRTLMNIHQVVENGRHLEKIVTEQAEEIKNLKETVAELEKKITGVHNVVYQLIGGLYCQRTQKNMIHLHLDVLNSRPHSNEEPLSNHLSGNWPTTRQGDENRKRIEKIEQKLKHIGEDLDDYSIL